MGYFARAAFRSPAERTIPQARAGVSGRFFRYSLIAVLGVARTLRRPLEVSLGVQYTADIAAMINALAALHTHST